MGVRGRVPVASATLALLLASALAPAFAAPAAAADPPSATAPFLTGLEFPVAMVFAPDGRLFFNEKYTGQIRIVDLTGALPVLKPTPFVVVPGLNTTAEMGLLGLALDPNFATTPWLYAYHTFNNGSVTENRITRYWAAANTTGAAEDIVRGIPAWDYHNGGILQFGPDGKLWVTTGDSNNGARSPDLTYLGGKVLRYNKDGTIPSDNPYPGSPVYNVGHRNMFGLTFDPLSGKAFVSENGELTNDEVNDVVPRADYGWPWDEGFANNTTKRNPLWAISPTIAPTAIIADRSRHAADNLTDLLFGDWNTGSLRRLTVGPPGYDRVLDEALVFTRGVSHVLDLDFGPGGLLYISTDTGIYTSDLHVVQNEPPVPVIKVNRTMTFVGKTVSFDGRNSFDPEGGGIFRHDWDFGDGTVDNGSFLRHNFSAPGNYTVRLTVADELKKNNSTTIVYRVLDPSENLPPVANVFISRPIQFVGRNVGFGVNGSYDPEDGGIYNQRWNFSDGTVTNGSYVNRTFASPGTYLANLTVADEFGAEGSAQRSVQILDPADNQPPVAVATGPRQGWATLPYNFSSSRSTDREGGVVGHVWDFGDGTNSSLGVVSHAYAAPGNYSITLTVSDELGATAATTFAFEAVDLAFNQPPAAVITPPPGTAKTEVELAFDGRDSVDPEGGITAHRWDFGDGTNATGAYVLHIYPAPGEYLVRLTVADETGAEGSATLRLLVRPLNEPPAASFTTDNWYAFQGGAIFFDASASGDSDGYLVNATWDFGDGTTAEGLQVRHTFTRAGVFTVTVTIVDDRGGTANASRSFEVRPGWAPPVEPVVGVAILAALGAEALFFAVVLLRGRRK